MKSIKLPLVFVALILGFLSTSYAQNYGREYYIDRGIVFYFNEPLDMADASSFIVLGYGYAKDRYNVYMNGAVLRYVDPSTFRLKINTVPGLEPYPQDQVYPYPQEQAYPYEGYLKTSNSVLFNGQKIEGASPSSFTELGGGYAKDSFNVYFMGKRVSDASSFSMKYLGDGYAADAFNAYYLGRKVEGSSVSSFKLLGRGYAEDTFNTYYRGIKVND